MHFLFMFRKYEPRLLQDLLNTKIVAFYPLYRETNLLWLLYLLVIINNNYKTLVNMQVRRMKRKNLTNNNGQNYMPKFMFSQMFEVHPPLLFR